MRILDNANQTHSSISKKAKSKENTSKGSDKSKEENLMTKKEPPVKNLSDDEIIAKLRAKKSAKESSETKKTPETNQKEEKDDMLLKSDVGSNNPNDPEVREKLKGILKSGAFNFSQKERDTLSKIL